MLEDFAGDAEGGRELALMGSDGELVEELFEDAVGDGDFDVDGVVEEYVEGIGSVTEQNGLGLRL